MSGVVHRHDVDRHWSPKVSTYDHFNAGLIASIVICSFVVFSLLVIWLVGSQQAVRTVPPLVNPYPVVTPENPAGQEQELDEVVGGTNGTELVSLLESVENAVSQQTAGLGILGDGDSLPGPPDDRKPSPISKNDHTSRWSVSFEVDGLEQYKRQLDFFGIEIGVLESRKDDVWRIGKLSSHPTVTQSNRENEQHSAWFAHSTTTLKRWDQQLAKESGIASDDRLFVQFYPADLVAKIMLLEANALQQQGRKLEDVDTTHIQISQSGDQFSVSISDFVFR